MKLVFNEASRLHCWVSSDGRSLMSPEFVVKEQALAWRVEIAKEHYDEYEEVRRQLDQLNEGDSIVVPKSKHHAESMLKMAHFYLDTLKVDKNESGTN